MNQNPEQIAHDKIDEMLREAGWLVQSKKKVDLSAGKGVAVREYQTNVGPADYVLFVDRKPVGIIEDNFNKWIFKQHTGQHNHFTQEQLDWLRMIKDHVVSSYHIEIDDLEYTPFDAKGGKGKMQQLFGNQMNDIMNELNEILAA